MKPRIIIAGSGKMALDIGLFFLHRQYPVFFVSRSAERLEAVAKKIQINQNRLERFVPEKNIRFTFDCFLLGEQDIPEADIIIETTSESLQAKKDAVQAFSHLIRADTLLLSNSSSILPHLIHPRCLGTHFFYPVEMTRVVELIIPGSCDETLHRGSLCFLRENGLNVLEQDDRSAFLINRLLVPLQAACFAALKRGHPPAGIEKASKSDLLSLGQLSLMDSIGLDVIFAAVTNYHRCAPSLVPADVHGLITCLAQLLQMGKVGSKNKNGLFMGETLPWAAREMTPEEQNGLERECASCLKDCCREALRQDMIPIEQLHLVLDRIFHAKRLPASFAADNRNAMNMKGKA